MKRALLFLLLTASAWAQFPSSAPNAGGAGGGAASSVFTGSTAVTSAFSATPTFTLSDISVKSPTRFQPGALTANVTGVTFAGPTAGAKFSVAWLQDGTGGRTVTYGASASNTCTVSPTPGKTTTQQFEVEADGTTIVGTGCTSDDPADTPITGSQYKTLSCQPGLGDGLNAIAAGTYLESTCWNKTGVTFTITGIQCFTDNAGTSTLNATNGAGTGLLTGAVTCSSTIASGTQSATTTIANNDFIKFTFVADGTSKQTTWVVAGTY